jgi:predicted TIM-barrel fold metal-dependent hydrolase
LSYNKKDGAESTTTLNDQIREISNKYDRFVTGIGTVEPTHGDAALEELHRLSENGFPGVVWHHRFQSEPVNGSITKKCVRRLEDLGLVAFVHCIPYSNLESLDRLEELVECTEQPIIVLDATHFHYNIDKIIELGNRYKHLYFDTALMFPLGLPVERLVNELGADRLVFGSDLYTQPLMFRYSANLCQIRNAEISNESKDMILEKNIRKLLNI